MIAILYPLKMTKNLYEAYSAIYEMGKATPESGTGKYYNEKKPTAKQLEVRKKMFPPKTDAQQKATQKYDKIKELTNKGQHKAASDLYKEDTKAMKDFLDKKAKKLEDEKKNQKPEYKNNPAFGDPSHHSNAKSKNEAYDNRYSDNTGKESKEKLKKLEKKRSMKLKGHPQFTRDDVGKFRKEWEALKLIETENYREQFDKWLDGIVEEGYDIERWSDEELVDTFINENNLWASREAVDSALLESDKKGKGSGKKDACYHKVKASASVWPSAYASGRLVQCRKKGAANYGNSKKKS